MLMVKSNNIEDTKDVAKKLARRILSDKTKRKSALVLALQGDLGSGKTTLTQSFAKALGVKEKITSPTFVLMKVYNLQLTTYSLRRFIHIDCYRLNSPEELEQLGFREILKDKDAIIIIEWAERVKKLLPKNTVWISFEYGDRQSERIIKFKTL
ncbi:MAG: tRNA (adenosine(37)-N6)-threonylcarbamoyltransferase complex ATPase subunit type 1 TsaE [bacterium]|nr:tRNA (adenosine(37)-N6)-threonylcarbamoyltransferase complex ATPase subunit type 1 TsaE [bacterium]